MAQYAEIICTDFENPRRPRIPEHEDCPACEISYYRAVEFRRRLLHTYHALLSSIALRPIFSHLWYD
jgi:hypothetical protein